MDKEKREIKVLKRTFLNMYGMNINLRISGDQQHIFARMRKYHIDDIDTIIDIVAQGVDKYLLNNIGKIDSNFVYIIDKQSCICIPCNIGNGKREGHTQQYVLIKTVFKITSKSGSLPTGNIIYINEGNPSPEWDDAIYDLEAHRGTYTRGGSASMPNPDEFVSRNFNWTPNKRKGEVLGDPLSYKAYDKLGDPENMNVHRTFINRLLDYHSEQERLNRQNSMKGQFNEYERNERARKVWDKVKLAKSLYDADTQPIDGINQGLRDVDSIRKKQYDDVLSMADNEPIHGLNQDLRDADEITRKRNNQNESIRLTQDDLRYIIFETVKRIKTEKRLS